MLHTVLGDSLQVASHPWDELRRAALRVGERLATLDEVLAAVGRGGPCHLVIEVKPAVDEACAARAAALVEALGGVSRAVSITVSSFDWRLLGVVRSAVGGGCAPLCWGGLRPPRTRCCDTPSTQGTRRRT